MKRNLLQKVFIFSLSCMLILISAGFSTDNKSFADPDNEADTKRTLKVLYWDEEAFKRTYGDLFSKEYPNTDIQVVKVTDALDDIKLIEKHSPDLVMLDPYNYKQMAKENKLVDLDPLIKRDHYDTTTLYPSLLAELKRQGGGKLYGLSPKVGSYAIMYNVDLFKKYNVKLPKDGMTWEEIFKLASKFPTKGDKDSRIWGLSSNIDPMEISRTEGLIGIDPNTLKATANTTAWKKAYQLSIEANNSGVIPQGNLSTKNYYESSAFIMGRSAMAVSPISMLKDLKAANSGVKNYKPFTLGMAAGPADPKDRKSTGNINISNIFAIPASASNVDAAWDFIKYFHGDDYAKEYYKPSNSNNSIGDPLSRMIKEYSGYSVDAFYKLRPNLDLSITRNALYKKSYNVEGKFMEILSKQLKLVADKKKTLKQAVTAIQSQTQAAADKVKKAQKAKK
ncbi:multiple sugar transport system substrate-binding protein [Paenibacillus sp. DS2015]|uniref:ABC transporter substrate-binding protein n=1 Tax=Paenibacillus sp. DS2015 TaxID=3373917 RepID=UPI003D19F941